MRPWTCLAVLGFVSGCRGETIEPRRSFTMRDSVGVEIVENAEPLWRAGEGWTVEGEPLFVLEAFDGGSSNRLLDPTSIDVDSRGRIIVGDGNRSGWHAILVYDSLGHFQFQAGRQGEGPGEFRQLWWAAAYRGDSLVAFDQSGDRLTVFDPEGGFERSFGMPRLNVTQGPRGSLGYTAGADAAFPDGYFLAYPSGFLDPDGTGPAWRKHMLVRLGPEGTSWDTLGTFGITQAYWTGSAEENIWFAPFAQAAVSGDRLYYGLGDGFEIREHDTAGALVRIFRRPYERRPVTDELRIQLEDWWLDMLGLTADSRKEVVDRIRAQVREGRFADVLPPYSAILFDATGYVWAEEFRWMMSDERAPTRTPAQWSIFDLDGVWLGNVETPSGFILQKVARDRLYGFVVDELNVKRIHAYRLDRLVEAGG